MLDATVKAQLERARAVLKAMEEHGALVRLIEAVERRTTPELGDEGPRVWLSLVRSSLSDPLDALLNEIRKESSGIERPLWWPEEPASEA